MATTSEDVWRLLAELTAAQKETDKQLKEVSQQQKETELLLKEVSQQQKENAQQQKETDKQLKELGKQIGGLGAKFGSFTEGLALPSMEVISPSVRVSKEGQHLEIDVLAYSNGELNTAYIVEVKSHARQEDITQLKSILQRFRRFFPEHKDKKLYGILAAVDLSPELREKILQEGLYVARIHDQVFELDIPDNFQPQTY
jgi:RecB family endonuclease NucS